MWKNHSGYNRCFEIGDISRFHKASQIVSLAGLYGDNSKSGSSVNKRGKISKKGSRYLRHAIYMVALNLHEETTRYLKLTLPEKRMEIVPNILLQ